MAFYEHVFLTRQDVSGQRVDELVEQFKGVIAGAGGTVGKTEYWGLKSPPSASRRTARRTTR